MTKVIFRKFKCGEVIALFPQEPATRDGWECMSYMHVGHHGSASPNIVYGTKPAKWHEFVELLRELQSIGYDDLKLCKKFTQEDYKIRQERARHEKT